ncbi:phage holin family protein [Bradyrhizobium roseum]|uniref:phage holin family protein n=1 Tax=Bradyrhizobium roseum TaxID=3056648 RepID=UPI002637E9E8|nr:phage holin family protein [Bradyrhizobium roseus]WKA27751.1 phage holin family protein [Bradyrhizobium roseus]
MLALSGNLLRAGIGLKLSQIKIATRSYFRDRTSQATGTMTSYAVAAGLFAAAGVFLIAASLVGTIALYRWIAIHYGQFWAFGAIGGLLVILAAICAGVAAARLKRPPPHFPSLTSRLRVAIKSNPLKPDQIEAARDSAAAVAFAPSAPPSGTRASTSAPQSKPALSNRNIQAGLIVAATLLGWAATRRRAQARQTGV